MKRRWQMSEINRIPVARIKNKKKVQCIVLKIEVLTKDKTFANGHCDNYFQLIELL